MSPHFLEPTPVAAQTQGLKELHYTCFNQKIPLTLRSHPIALQFKPADRTRSRSNHPLYLQLQQDLHKGGGTQSYPGALRYPLSHPTIIRLCVSPNA